jgi:hypothetical protein
MDPKRVKKLMRRLVHSPPCGQYTKLTEARMTLVEKRLYLEEKNQSKAAV